jgi:hypothetical protein
MRFLIYMVILKRVSRACLVGSTVIILIYLGDRLSSSALVPIDLYAVPSIQMFGLLLIMSALVGVSFMIENYLTTV